MSDAAGTRHRATLLGTLSGMDDTIVRPSGVAP
jgi:hypothetical protein